MGQVLRRVYELQDEAAEEESFQDFSPHPRRCHDAVVPKRFSNLANLPPEIALLVLSHLNATDLCLASCVWENLGNDEILWHSLCHNQWCHVSVYSRWAETGQSYKKLYLQLDEATLTFNADPELGMDYLFKNGLVDDTPTEIALFLHTAKHIDWQKKRLYLASRQEIVERMVRLQDFENQFLPNALRKFFKETTPPNERSDYLSLLVETFSKRFCQCNPRLGMSKDTVFVACFSLIMLSVDLSSPHIKNKMSKREFIRNTKHAAHEISEDFAGHLYDNVYLIGHVAPKA